MKIETTRFGVMDVKDDQIVTFPQGLLGFSKRTQFTLFPDKISEPFQWLQSLEIPPLALIVVDPDLILSDYKFSLEDDEVKDLGSIQIGDFQVLIVVTVGATIQDLTLNLLGPILINKNTRLARQIVLDDSEYSANHYIFITRRK